MEIAVGAQTKIYMVQKEFSGMFPFLKIEFFLKRHKIGQASPKKTMCRSDEFIGTYAVKLPAKQVITITPNTTVANLEQEFNKTYGLSVQVFRKSGNVWLETTVTDQWTLKKQNEVGKSLSAPPEEYYSSASYEDLDLR